MCGFIGVDGRFPRPIGGFTYWRNLQEESLSSSRISGGNDEMRFAACNQENNRLFKAARTIRFACNVLQMKDSGIRDQNRIWIRLCEIIFDGARPHIHVWQHFIHFRQHLTQFGKRISSLPHILHILQTLPHPKNWHTHVLQIKVKKRIHSHRNMKTPSLSGETHPVW